MLIKSTGDTIHISISQCYAPESIEKDKKVTMVSLEKIDKRDKSTLVNIVGEK